MNDYTYSLVKLYFPVRTRSTGEDDDPAELQRAYFPDLSWAFSMSYQANHFPHHSEDLPDGVKPALHYLTFSPTLGVLLCCGYDIKKSILERSDPSYFKYCLSNIVEDLDGVFSDGWGEGGFHTKTDNLHVSASFYNDLALIVTDVPNVDAMHVKWHSIDEIEHLDWVLHYKAYEWLYRGMRYADQTPEQLKYLTDHRNLYFFA